MAVTLNLIRCVLTSSSANTNCTVNNTSSTFDMWEQTWPAWNASQDSWRFISFFDGWGGLTTAGGTPPYTGYATDTWGNPRVLVGGGISFATYIDVAKVSSGSGISTDPGNYNYMLGIMNNFDGISGSVFYLKGAIDLDSNWTEYGVKDYLLPWNPYVNGPWRIKTSNATTYVVGTIKGAVFYQADINNSIYLNDATFLDCFIKADGTFNCSIDGVKGVFKGCTVVANSFLVETNKKYILQDTIISAPWNNNDWQASTFDATRCTFTDSRSNIVSKVYVYRDTSCQYGWTAPTWPSWDASKADFISSTLLAGITTPPAPGTPPYTDYTSDLWGVDRNNIGAAFMGTIPNPPVINTHPTDQKVIRGGTLNLSVDATNGSLHYQWKQDGTNVGSDSSTYQSTNFGDSSRGKYRVYVGNTDGTTISNDATVQMLPYITAQPQDQNFAVGSSAEMSVTATGYNLTYQWIKDSTVLSGKTSNPLVLTPYADSSKGVYKVAVYSDGNDTTSTDATVTTYIPKMNYFSDSTVGDGTGVTSYINKTDLINAISSDNYFDSTDKLGSVFVYYTHEEGRQKKRFLHRLDSFNNLTVTALWSDDAKDGTWQKTMLRVYDKDGAEHIMTRADIGTAEDIIHKNGFMYLNT